MHTLLPNIIFAFLKSNEFYKNRKIIFVRIIQSSTETFRREKSARNTIVSSTREF